MGLSNGSLLQAAADRVYRRVTKIAVICWLALMLSVFSPTGQSQAEPETEGFVLKDSQGQLIGRYKESHALLIGVSHYGAGWSNLEAVPEQLDLVETTLKRQGFNVIKRLNPSGSQLKRAFEDFIDSYGRDADNRLLFYFSGHGYTRSLGEKGYLIPADAPHPERDDLGFLRKALSMPQILAWSRILESKHALFLFDSCFSATVFKANSLSAPPAPISRLTAKPARQYITACRAGEQLVPKSAFAEAFVDALQFGLSDLNADGYITGTELGRYLHSEIPKHAAQTPQFGKNMDYKLSRGDFVFMVRSPYDYSAESQGRLWIKTHPAEARVRILNIKQKYTPGIKLAAQHYQIEVSSPGYLMQRQWISLAEGEDKYITLRLQPRVTESTISVVLTVAGWIQTDDPWIAGNRNKNDWAKPIYRIWFDSNGNPHDGGWGNGQGPKQAEVWLDTGRLGFHWNGKDGKSNTDDDLLHWPILKSSENRWKQGGIEAQLSPDRRSLRVTLPLTMIGSPKSLEVSFMTSPWTSDASDNLGLGGHSQPAWVVISDTKISRVYSGSDPGADNRWPGLIPDRRANFDLLETQVEIDNGSDQSQFP